MSGEKKKVPELSNRRIAGLAILVILGLGALLYLFLTVHSDGDSEDGGETGPPAVRARVQAPQIEPSPPAPPAPPPPPDFTSQPPVFVGDPLASYREPVAAQPIDPDLQTALRAPTLVAVERLATPFPGGPSDDPLGPMAAVLEENIRALSGALQDFQPPGPGLPPGFPFPGDLFSAAPPQPAPQAASASFAEDVFLAPRPASPYEIRAGTAIPAILRTEVNSDLPGIVTAQISRDVYDTVTGRHLLIPAGSRLTGTYSSDLRIGQDRLLLQWDRLRLPDGTELRLPQLGSYQGGAGLADRVNHHTGAVIGRALLLSIVGAGIQLGQGERRTDGIFTDREVAAGAVTSELGRASSQLLRQRAEIPPTIRIRAGTEFAVIPAQNLILAGPYPRSRP